MARRPRARRGAGASSPVPLIIFVVLFVFALGASVMMWREQHDLNDRINGGYRGGLADNLEFKHFENRETEGYKFRLIEQARRLEAKIADFNKLEGFAGLGVSEVKEWGDRVKRRSQELGVKMGDNDVLKLTVYAERLELRIQQLQTNLKALEDEKADIEEKRQQLAKDKNAEIAGKNESIANLRTEASDTTGRHTQETTKNNQEIAQLRETISQKDEAHLTETEKKNQQATALKDKIAQLEKQLAQLQDRDAKGFDPQIAAVDGKVIHVNLQERTAMLDVGRQDGVRRGLRFDVYEVGVGGRRRLKGQVEVKSVHAEISYAGILGMSDELDPILTDNILVSPAFERGKPMVFTIEPKDFDETDVAVLRTKLERFGNKLVAKPALNVRYCVIGERLAKGKRAVADECARLGIPVIKMSDLENVLGVD